MKKMRIKTFVLPVQDEEATDLINREDVRILINERHLCAKDGIILLHLQYEEDVYDEGEGGIF